MTGSPFKARINGNKCILIIENDGINIEFEKIQKHMVIKYCSMRCVQHWRESLLVNIEDDRPMLYDIVTPMARKIYESVMEKISNF